MSHKHVSHGEHVRIQCPIFGGMWGLLLEDSEFGIAILVRKSIKTLGPYLSERIEALNLKPLNPKPQIVTNIVVTYSLYNYGLWYKWTPK